MKQDTLIPFLLLLALLTVSAVGFLLIWLGNYIGNLL